MGPALRLSKPPLITPSASPQPPRFSSRLSEHPSPSKKQRRAFHDSSSSSNSRTQTPVPDVQKEREASRLRLLDVWASLAERYSRHMDDDDLVDIRTGEIIKDNGVLRNAPTLQFGTLAAPVAEMPVDEMVEVDDEEDEEDEYYDDELDAFAEASIDTEEEAKSEVDTEGLIVPPATLLDQAYADDLRDFLQAEKVRKEQCGTDVDEESEEQQSIRDDSEDITDTVVELEAVRVPERRLGRSYEKMRELAFPSRVEDKDDGLELIQGQGACSEPIVITSDDELDFWKADNFNTVQDVHKDEIYVSDSDIEIFSLPLNDSSITQCKNTRTPKPRQLHTPPRSHSSSKPSTSPSTRHTDGAGHSKSFPPSDFSGDDSFPSGHPRKGGILKQKSSHVKPVSPQMSNSMVHPSAKIFRRHHSPSKTCDRGSDTISPVPSAQGAVAKPKQRAVVLLTPRNALKQHADSHISGFDRNDDDLPETSSRRLSRRKGKAKEWGDVVVTTPDKYSTGRKVKVPLHTELYVTDTSIDESASESPPFTKANFVEKIHNRPGSHPQPHSLKRRRDSYSPVDMPERTMEATSPRRQIASGSHSSCALFQNRLASENSPSIKWHSKESRSDSDSEPDEPVSEQNQWIRRKRSVSCVGTQVPHFLYPYTTPNHQEQFPNFTPIPDPRAQLIIAQAVQQLSALVTGIWQPPAPHYLEGSSSSPRTPQRRGMSIPPSASLHTPPTHPHMYPHLYDPAFSGASFPPESPELEYHATPSRRSLLSRSHSRVRKVSFQLESDTEEVSAHRTPTSNRRSMNADALSKRNSKRDDNESPEGPRRTRGRTPGPSSNFSS